MNAVRLAAYIIGGCIAGYLLQMFIVKLQAWQVIRYAERLNESYVEK